MSLFILHQFSSAHMFTCVGIVSVFVLYIMIDFQMNYTLTAPQSTYRYSSSPAHASLLAKQPSAHDQTIATDAQFQNTLIEKKILIQDNGEVLILPPNRTPHIPLQRTQSEDALIYRPGGVKPINVTRPPRAKEIRHHRQRGERAQGRSKYGPIINAGRNWHQSETMHGNDIVLPSIGQMMSDTSRRFYSDNEDDGMITHGSNASLYNYGEMCLNVSNNTYPVGVVAGLYNTGTNVLFRLVHKNCQARMRYQPEWGKHEMVTLEKVAKWDASTDGFHAAGFYQESMLLVVVKDPLTWMKSMCKANYDFRYFNASWFFESCPGNIRHSRFDWLPLNRGRIMNGKKISNGKYASPVHLWNDWYSTLLREINAAKYPFMLVRYEDLLFRVQSVATQLCGCLGRGPAGGGYKTGVNATHLDIAEDATKPHGHSRNRTMSFYTYSDPQYRYDGYTAQDLRYMLDVIDPSLLQRFGYEFDVEKTKRMRL